MHRHSKFMPLSVVVNHGNIFSDGEENVVAIRPAHPMASAVELVNSISEAGSGSRFVAFFLRSAGTERRGISLRT